MRLELERRLPVTRDIAWGLVTDPELMNRWSTARIELVATGDGGSPGGVGALRRVAAPGIGRPTRLAEVIEHADAPSRLVYRVYAGGPMRFHRGTISLESARGRDRDETILRWRVEAEFPVPGIGFAAERMLRPALEESLDRMVRVAPDAPVRPLPPARDVDTERTVELRSAAERVRDEQRALAARLTGDADPQQWFARVYRHVTDCQLEHCDRGRATHAVWVYRTIVRFYDYYAENLKRLRREAPGEVEAHWRKAFGVAEHGARGYRRPDQVFAVGLYAGMRAHIEHDLPRALADVWRASYRGRCDYARFRADYLLMGHVFRDASMRLLDELPRAWVPVWMRAIRAALPPEALDRAIARRFYDIPRHRLTAFERGAALAAGLDGAHA